MFEENAFKTAYRQAYDRITPGKACIRRLGDVRRDMETQGNYRIFTGLRTALAVLAPLCLTAILCLPATAKAFPRVYAAVVKYAPMLADYCLPEEYSCTQEGIIMQVESIKMEGKSAEVVVSFSDAEEAGNLIKGTAALSESYRLTSYGTESTIGGCSFLGYDESADKAYFMMDVTAPADFDGTKLTLRVDRLLTDCREEIREIPLDDIVKNPVLKQEILTGVGGRNREVYEKQNIGKDTENSYRPIAKVMDLKTAGSASADDLTVTGIGFGDGILRVQVCRGNLEDTDRHVMLYLADAEGQEHYGAADSELFLRNCEASVMWHEEINGERLVFDELWFAVDESELKELKLYGRFCYTDGCVKGKWEVTFQLGQRD